MMKDITGYEGYKINENGVIINKKGHVMRPAINKNGYFRIALETYDENGKLLKRTNESVHRLVAKTFLDNPDNLPLVMHKDNDTLHNHVSNLKWGTASENIKQAFDEGRKISPHKDNHDKYMYEVFNDDKSDIILCKGREGVANLIGFAEKTVRPGKILSGKYKDYIIYNTHKKVKSAVIFNKNN